MLVQPLVHPHEHEKLCERIRRTLVRRGLPRVPNPTHRKATPSMKPTPIKPPPDNRLRADRGGGWDDFDAAWVRAAARVTFAPAGRNNLLGFRCAQRGARMTLKVTP